MLLGIDIGSVSVTLAGINHNQEIIHTDFLEHAGDIRSALRKLLDKIPSSENLSVAAAAPSAVLDPGIIVYDSTVCVINGVRFMYPRARSILHAGGQRFFLAELGDDGTYRRSKGSSSCAAGTGSFLDQQARRLGLPGSFRIAELASENMGSRPVIASRCAVFAKTDLIHAQQEGYSIAEICDGLCFGLARNIGDTVISGRKPLAPLVMSGGVTMNSRVVEYMGELLGTEPLVGEYARYYGALGACLELLKNQEEEQEIPLDQILTKETGEHSTYYPPLQAELPEYPDFLSGEMYREPGINDPDNNVEVEIFSLPKNSRGRIGFDIGSTSTKAVITEAGGRVLFGFYTRTAGRPLNAVRSILRCVENLLKQKKLSFRISQAAATGSGRKFVGAVIGADLIVDEITAHAKAAYSLNPETDTIIEIGGQDAKFTTMRRGNVTFSQMNAVCAAGTGSFIEEQAAALNVPLSEYAERADRAQSPMASDRCTVFMERDIKQFLNTGYPVNQLLAAVLHSVRENYLQKVAVPGEIGDHICFQGATGKNRALVAAFAQKLNKPVYVSRYCHLTGALGAAMILEEENPGAESFRGIGIFRNEINVRSERCGFCRNHCRIRIARVGDEEVAYGFLCGRDYETRKYVPKTDRSFGLLAERRRLLKEAVRVQDKMSGTEDGLPVIGIPAALHLADDLPVWETFFRSLGFPVVTSTGFDEGITLGRKVSGSEFCSPLTELHGHVMHLLSRSDYVFVPEYFQHPAHASRIKEIPEENRNFKPGSFYCYYTQYASVLMEEIAGGKYRGQILRPLIGYQNYGEQGIISQLSKMVSEITAERIPPDAAARAYRKAAELDRCYRLKLRQFGESIIKNKSTDINIVITGRPYTVLSPKTNKNIPEIISGLGIKPVFQDMMSESPYPGAPDASEMLSFIPWTFAYQVIKTAYRASVTPGLYPIFVSSFKCSPDSFITEYFKRIMERAGKPYLILQVDDHDSSVGYETRIEAGIRAFRNHMKEEQSVDTRVNAVNVVPELTGSMT
ncbi:MAG: acyl-CoA dehydratase activase, partial [Spirochaetia bacterium]